MCQIDVSYTSFLITYFFISQDDRNLLLTYPYSVNICFSLFTLKTIPEFPTRKFSRRKSFFIYLFLFFQSACTRTDRAFYGKKKIKKNVLLTFFSKYFNRCTTRLPADCVFRRKFDKLSLYTARQVAYCTQY